MTLTELETHFRIAASMIAREKKMRAYVFRGKPELPEKLADCDRAMTAVVAMKDELKARIAPGVQEALFDVPETKKAGGY